MTRTRVLRFRSSPAHARDYARLFTGSARLFELRAPGRLHVAQCAGCSSFSHGKRKRSE